MENDWPTAAEQFPCRLKWKCRWDMACRRFKLPLIMGSSQVSVLMSETSAPSDMFTQMRTAFALQRGLAHSKGLTDPNFTPKLISARDVIHFATIEGPRQRAGTSNRLTYARKEGGSQCLRTDLINVLPMNDPYGVVVSSMDTSNVDTVMINGQFVKWHGVLTGVEHASIRRMVNAARDRVFSRRANEVERGPPQVVHDRNNAHRFP